MLKRILLFLLSVLGISTADAQSISGFVLDSMSQEPISYSSIVALPSGQGTLANEDGYFSLSYLPQDTTIALSRVGYATLHLSLSSLTTASQPLQFLLTANSTLSEVEVRADRLDLAIDDIGVVHEPILRLQSIPAMLGGRDLLKALQFYPGITGGTEGSSTLIVRGGSHDQNLFLLDGVPIYNTDHAFGYLSTINPETVKTMHVHKGAIPARYGGRLSSVVSMITQEGNYTEHKASASLGIALSSFKLEGPIKKDKTTYLAAARLSYSNLIGAIARAQYDKGAKEDYAAFDMIDYNIKVSHRFSDRSKLGLSAYQSYDESRAYNRIKGSNEESIVRTNWKNKNAVLNYSLGFSTKHFLRAKAYYSRYDYQIANSFQSTEELFDLSEDSGIRDIGAQFHTDWTLPQNKKLSSGLEYHAYRLTPQVISGTLSNEDARAYDFSEITAYADHHRLLPGTDIQLESGLRISYLSTQSWLLEPRIALSSRLSPRLGWKASYNINHQYLHQLERYVSIAFVRYWLPAEALGQAQASRQIDLGLTYLASPHSTWNLELYHKKYSHLLELRPGTDQVFDSEIDWTDQFVSDGTGKAYGAGLSWSLQRPLLQLQASYNYSWSDRQFQQINQGRPFEANFNKQHDLKAWTNIALDRKNKWSLQVTAILQSGRPYTLAAHIFDALNTTQPIYPSINNENLPIYKRIDLQATKKWTNKNGATRELNFGLYNAFGFRNIQFLEVHYRGISNNDPILPPSPTSPYPMYPETTTYIVEVEGVGFFQFIPSLNYNIQLW